MKAQLLFLVLLLSVASCKNNEESSEEMAIAMVKLPPKAEEAASSAKDYSDSKADDRKVAIEQKIIKTGNLRFETSDVEKTHQQIVLALKKHNCFVQNDTEGKVDNSIFRRLTIRVPSKNFESLLDDISKGVTYFDTKDISSEDVTEQYIDVEARLKTKKILENRYLELLKKTTKVTEMLEIEGQLSVIREEIEAKQGQLFYLKNQISMSTIDLEFYKTIANNDGITISYGSKIGNAILSGFNSLSDFLIGLLSKWPLLIIFMPIFYLIRKWLKKRTKKSDI